MKKSIFLFSILFVAALFTGCTKEVTDYDLTVTFQGNEITGKYTGQLVDNVASDDAAAFTYESGYDYLNYTGAFENGQFSGNGTLETNFFTTYFEDSNSTGEYTGELVNGKANGQGTYKATNTDNEIYTYTGEWENDMCSGQGSLSFENKDYDPYSLDGNFTEGNFTPSKLECLNVWGQNPNLSFTITDKASDFIKNNEDIFPVSDINVIKDKINYSLDYRQLIKNINNYGNELISFNEGHIIGIYENNSYGYDFTEVQVTTGITLNTYYIFYFGKLNDLYIGDNVEIYGLPIATMSATNLSNTTTKSVVLLGSYITKQ